MSGRPTLAPTAPSAASSGADALVTKYAIPVGRFKLSRTHLKDPKIRMSDRQFGNVLTHVIDPTQFECDPSTPVLDWLDAEVAKIPPDVLDLIFSLAGDQVAFLEPFLFESPGKDQFFGYEGEFTNAMNRTDRKVKGFWDIFSSDIRLLGAHGTVLLNVKKVAATYEIAFVNDDGSPISHADAVLFANFLRDAVVQTRSLKRGNHPLLSFNAVAFGGGGPFSDAIVVGDGVLEGFKAVGLDDVAPAAVYAHEFGHQIQDEEGFFNDRVPKATTDAEVTMYFELMADAYAGYYLTHKLGAGFQRRRVEQFLQIFFQLGDCAFTNPGHHGTPNQRMKAARLGFAIADEMHNKDRIFTARQFHFPVPPGVSESHRAGRELRRALSPVALGGTIKPPRGSRGLDLVDFLRLPRSSWMHGTSDHDARRRAVARLAPWCRRRSRPICSASRPRGSASWRCCTPSRLFMAGIFPLLLFSRPIAPCCSASFMHWGPSTIAIIVAVLVAVVIGRVPVSTVLMTIGLVFEVASSYGIAAAEFSIRRACTWGTVVGLSWVAVWTCSSRSSCRPRPGARRWWPPGVRQLGAGDRRARDRDRRDAFRPRPMQFFFFFVFPYLLVVGMAYVGARVVYGLGTEVKRRARAGQLSAGRAARPGRHGRGLARAASPAGAARGDQADPAGARRTAERASRRRRGAGSSARRRPRAACARPTRSSSSTSASPTTARSTTSWSCSTASTSTRSCASFGPVPAERGDLPPAPGVSLAVRSGVARPGPSRHQAREHLPLPLRRGVRLRQGAGLRHREGARRRARDAATDLTTRDNTSRARPRSSRPSRRSGQPTSTAAPTSTPPAAWPTGC